MKTPWFTLILHSYLKSFLTDKNIYIYIFLKQLSLMTLSCV